MYKKSGKLNFTYTTGAIVFSTSKINVVYPTTLLPALSTFVAPIFPEPISLMFFF